ncbi:MAG: ATP-binding protein [Rhodospirillales bacterium]|nr:ATP-binding protein [Rhodospirillales bacterium]
MYKRFAERLAKEALSDTPVVLIIGPRRVGKTTLARKMEEGGRVYLTLDDQTALDAAQSDPAGFIRGLDRAIIDEIQRAPELLLAIKKTVDEDYRPGRFLLTGSANVMTLQRVADSLAGRIETLRMLPLARAEIAGTAPTFLERLFAGELQGRREAAVGDELVRIALVGGFPEAITRESERRRQAWARSWLTSVLTRDLQDIAEIEKLTELPRFVRFLAEHSGQLVNYSQFGSSIGVSYKTGQRYVGLLEQVFLVATLQPWYTNALKRIARTRKLHFLDSGLLATARGLTFNRIKANRREFGALLESFAFSETLKLVAASDLQLTPYYFRDQQMREVDIVLERDDGMIAGIEVKASATVRSGDFSGLRTLAAACEERFAHGVVLYDGTEFVPFADRLAAAPLACMWA